MNIRNYNLDWGEYFRLDETSPSGLVRIRNYLGKTIEKYNVGNRGYYTNGDKSSWSLSFKGKMYQVHRIIWVLTYGSIDPELVIDHLDGDPFNNKIENLSLKSQEGNTRNKRQYDNNKTGITGVKLVKGKWDYYEANWYDKDGFQKTKCFSLIKFGEEKAKSLAISCREEQMLRLISEDMGYTERHGTKKEINEEQAT